jgi:hypothetical protein
MKRFFVSAVSALLIGVALSAQAVPAGPTTPQNGPDLSGRWRSASGSGGSAGWGPQVEIAQSGVNVTVKPGSPSRLRLDGIETAEVLSVDGCKNTSRITKAEPSRDHVTITTWIVIKSGCAHLEDEDDPLVSSLGVVDAEKVRGRRKLESITAVYREGDALTVETTRLGPDGQPATTTTTYRK